MRLPIRSQFGTTLFALAAFSTGSDDSTPKGRSVPVPLPILTSLGVTKENGAPVGVIGGREQFRVQAPAGKTFRSLSWKITGTIGKYEVRFNQNPLVSPLPIPTTIMTPADTTESVVEFHWDGSGGPHSIEVTAVYTDGTIGTPERFSPPIPD